jgi:DnaJ like chaperone protein
MTLILLCALLGFWLLHGVNGLLIGALIGFALSRMGQGTARQGLQAAQSQFLESTFAVMGALCKADGVVTRDEIRVSEELFARLQLSPEQKDAAKAAFTRGKAPDFDLDAEVDRVLLSARGSVGMFQLFLQVQLTAIAADGQVHPAEHEMLVRVARRLGLSELDVARLEALLRAAAGGSSATSGPPPKQRIDDAYAALGISPEASESEIKRAYRKLMSENHPDKLAAKGLPESMRQLAEQRAREINVAYDLIRKARQFT